MSVSGEHPITFRPYRGSSDPALPGGIWLFRGGLLNDASGGSAILEASFKDAGPFATVSRLFSLEILWPHIVGTARVLSLTFDNWDWDRSPGALAANLNLAIATTAEASGGRTAPVVGQQSINGLFLGAPLKNTANTTIALQNANVNGETLALVMSGYWWNNAARDADGGPRKPPGGILG